MLPYLIVKSFKVLKTCTVFICSNDHTRLRQGLESLVDALCVLGLEEMVIGKSQRGDRPTLFLQIALHLQRRGYAREQQHILSRQWRRPTGEWRCLLREDGNRRVVIDAGEIELLVRIEVHGFGKYTKLHRLQVFGALRDDHDVCTALAIETLTQPSCRQELVVDDQPVIVD